MAISLADDSLDWMDFVTAGDLERQGLSAQSSESLVQVVNQLATEMNVDLAGVGRCLALLRQGQCMLCGGAPLAMLAYSLQLDTYRASFDGACHDDLSDLSVGGAGFWLMLASAELGELPATEAHWLMVKFVEGEVMADNTEVLNLARNYRAAHGGVNGGHSQPLNDYEEMVGRAFWWCADHCLS
jgi:hypothetical protein